MVFSSVSDDTKAIMCATAQEINPAAMQRQIQALASELSTIAQAKNTPSTKRALPHEATNAF
ncbi:MAG: hypothetical protein ACRCSF_09545 [Mycobacteriaceae bacterium]